MAIPPLHLRARMLAQGTTRSGPKGGNHQHESSDIREFSYCAPMTVSAAKACPELPRNYLKHLVAGSKDGPETLLERLLSRKALERERESQPLLSTEGAPRPSSPSSAMLWHREYQSAIEGRKLGLETETARRDHCRGIHLRYMTTSHDARRDTMKPQCHVTTVTLMT